MAILVVTYDSATGGFRTQKIGSAQISDGAIVSGKIAANIIATPHMANQGILSASIGALAVGTPHIAANAIVSGKIVQSQIALALLGERAHGSLTGVTANLHHAEFTSGMHVFAHPSALIANGAIISAKIPANAIGGGHILDGSIGGADLANQAVISAKIGLLAVGTPHIAALAITSGKVASGGLSPLSSGKIWAGYTGNIAREESKPTGAVTFLALTDTPGDYSGNVNKVVAVNVGENALEFADPIPKTTDWKGSFNWDTSVYTTGEQDISALFSETLDKVVRRKYSVKLDLTTVEADGSFDELYLAVKEEIQADNPRAIDRKTITKAQIAAIAEPGIIIEIPATSEKITITMKMKTALAGDATIYYSVVKEHLE